MADTSWADALYQQERMYVEVVKQECVLVSSLGAKLSKDGNQWCWLLGDNLQDGVAGFGDTPYEAMIAFNKAFTFANTGENARTTHSRERPTP